MNEIIEQSWNIAQESTLQMIYFLDMLLFIILVCTNLLNIHIKILLLLITYLRLMVNFVLKQSSLQGIPHTTFHNTYIRTTLFYVILSGRGVHDHSIE